jgi:phosphoribosylamine---glycine ligase
MRILVIGGGGREHALVWKLRQSARVTDVCCAPGNPGIAQLARCVPLAVDDLDGIVAFVEREDIGLTVVGPELPLTLGLVDRLAAVGRRAFGPSQAAAQLEGSKVFTKELLDHLGVPTAAFGAFTDPDAAARYVRQVGAPVVVKADGLAAGKGVYICPTVDEALQAIDDTMRTRVFGAAGTRVVIEEFLDGEEVSFMALTDGTTALPLATSQDHKRIFDGDQGPNTGGMGAYSPAPVATPALTAEVMRTVIDPVVRGLAARGITYRGVLYAGLMVKDGHAKVLEFNVRFGDPECQVLLARLRTDLVELMESTCTGQLATTRIEWDPRPAVCVVLAAAGYPGVVRKGDPIDGLDAARDWPAGQVFHAGTKQAGDRIVTDGGRVLGVTALGGDIAAAVATAYEGVRRLHWPGMQYRTDIGHRALARP